MKMSPETYNVLLNDIRKVVEKLVETGAVLQFGRPFDADKIEMRDMWDMLLVANIDRSSESHPRHDHPGLLPRCLEFTDRDLHWLSRREGEDLDDVHIETALKRIAVTIKAERTAPVEIEEVASLTPSV